MTATTCIVCHLPAVSLGRDGVCETCRTLDTRLVGAPAAEPPVVEVDGAAVTVSAVDAGMATATAPTFGAVPVAPAAGWQPALANGRLRLGAKIGGGGMGAVYLAYDDAVQRTVAVKFLNPELDTRAGVQRFATEARALARLEHPNVVRLYEFAADGPTPYLVMEHVAGRTLAKECDKAPLAAARVAALGVDLCRGVQAAHDVGVIHRDLKPSNVMLPDGGGCKVVDFGLAKRVDVDDGLTADGHAVAGTPGFLATEQADPDVGKCGERTDVWGVGATLYAALTGVPPFPPGRKNIFRVLTEPLLPPRDRVKGVPRELDAIVCKCLEKAPAARYASVEEVAADLERWQSGRPTLARPVSLPVRAWMAVRRIPRAVVVTAAVVLLAAGGAYALTLLPRGDAAPSTATTPPDADPVQEALRAGTEVDLIEPGKLPKHPVWLITEETPIVIKDGACTLSSRPSAFLQLHADPGLDSYRIAAELQQLDSAGAVANKPTASERCGVFWGFRADTLPDGSRFAAVEVADFNDRQVVRGGQVLQNQVAFQALSMITRPLGWRDPTKTMGPNTRIQSPNVFPGALRTLVVDVTPDLVTFSVDGGAPVPLDHTARGVMWKSSNDVLAAAGGRGFDLSDRPSRAPVGVYVIGSTVAVRRFTLSPLPR